MKFGIVPYFVELLNSQLKNLEYSVARLDESFNCVTKKEKTKTKNNKKTTTKETATTTTTKKNKWICIFDFGILTKALWLQGTIVQNASVTEASLNSSFFRTSSSFFR